MRLSELARAAELAEEMQVFAELERTATAGGTLVTGVGSFDISGERLQSYFRWRRQQIAQELRALGLELDEDASPAAQFTEITPERVDRAVPQSGGAATKMTREDATVEAEQRLIPGVLADYAAGRIDDDKLAAARRRFADRIEALAQDILNAPRAGGQLCARCYAEATTTIAGQPYCATHAASAPRPAIPRLAR